MMISSVGSNRLPTSSEMRDHKLADLCFCLKREDVYSILMSSRGLYYSQQNADKTVTWCSFAAGIESQE